MFRRRNDTDTAVAGSPAAPADGSTVITTGKGRPTPTRREAEAAAKARAKAPRTRKEQAAAKRRVRADEAQKVRTAMKTGDERHLLPRDKGPVRRYIRDHVDARWNVGEFLLPVMLVVLALSFLRTLWAINLTVLLVYGLMIVAVIDSLLMWRGLKKRLQAKFGEDTYMKGLAMYAVMRGFQLRRSRMPRPLVKRGEYPS